VSVCVCVCVPPAPAAADEESFELKGGGVRLSYWWSSARAPPLQTQVDARGGAREELQMG